MVYLICLLTDKVEICVNQKPHCNEIFLCDFYVYFYTGKLKEDFHITADIRGSISKKVNMIYFVTQKIQMPLIRIVLFLIKCVFNIVVTTFLHTHLFYLTWNSFFRSFAHLPNKSSFFFQNALPNIPNQEYCLKPYVSNMLIIGSNHFWICFRMNQSIVCWDPSIKVETSGITMPDSCVTNIPIT